MKTNFKTILNQFCSLDFDEEEAQDHWYQILGHQRRLEEVLRRPIGFTVALTDYLLNRLNQSLDLFLIEKEKYHQARNSAIRDPLTGLFNKGFLRDYLEKELNKAKRYSIIFSVLFLDVDHFKELNDHYGHLVGDDVIRGIAKVLRNCFRKSDVIARYGGEEFVVVMPQTSGQKAMEVARRFCRYIEAHPFKVPNSSKSIRITLSGGIAIYPTDASDCDLLLRKADQALYVAKSSGRNRIFTSEKQSTVKR